MELEYRGGPIWGIDQNTKSGIAEGEPGSAPVLHTVNFRRDDTDTPEDLYERATFYFADRFRHDPPGLIAIERVVPPSAAQGFTNHNTTLVTLGIYAIVIGIVRCKSIPLRIVGVSTWRKAFLGKGNLAGDVAKRAAVTTCKRLGWEPEDHNSAEAGGIWFWACGQVAPRQLKTTKPFLFGEALAS